MLTNATSPVCLLYPKCRHPGHQPNIYHQLFFGGSVHHSFGIRPDRFGAVPPNHSQSLEIKLATAEFI
jgi:hypothetical protein